MNITKLIFIYLVVIFVLCASSPLICWTIGWDLQWHRTKCWSTEFETEPIIYAEPTITPVPTVYIEPTATLDWFPQPYVTSTPTGIPYPFEPYPWE